MKKVVLIITAFFCAGLAFADYNSMGIPDSAEIRKQITESWITAPINELRAKNPELHENDAREIFQVRMEEGAENVAIIVSPQSFLKMDIIKNNVNSSVEMAVYPEGAPGSWVLYREKKTGKAVRMVWYFNSDAGIYIQFVPEGNKVFADLIVYNSFAARAVPVGVTFARLCTSSFGEVKRWTSKTIPWDKVKVIPTQYHETLQMVHTIREKLPLMDYAEDVCYSQDGKLYSILTNKPYMVLNEDGEYVEPEENGRLTLSSAGFVKWIVDGIVSPYTEKGTDIAYLVHQTVDFNPVGRNGIISQENSLTFYLDWVRNLASAAISARHGKTFSHKDGGVDVNIRPFSGKLVNGTIVKSAGYIPDTGYEIAELKSLLYILAATEPSYFYLGAVKKFSKVAKNEFVFADTFAVFPYFDDTGRFDCFVFTRGAELSLEDFVSQNEDCFIHLERVRATDYFFPR
ncbi:MAG: hypothetical protein J5780_01005 [Treponema sp.]|nr:hypothetical protein [Treponema sp.]